MALLPLSAGVCVLHYKLLNLTISVCFFFRHHWEVVVTVALWTRGFLLL